VVAALLGAEEIRIRHRAADRSGCIMMRVCHLDTCPVGVATQNPLLRERFTASPSLWRTSPVPGEEVRIPAELGFRTLDEAVGQVSCSTCDRVDHWKAAASTGTHPVRAPQETGPRSRTRRRPPARPGSGHVLIAAAAPALEDATAVTFDTDVRNQNRSVGAMLGGEVARRYGGAGLPDAPST